MKTFFYIAVATWSLVSAAAAQAVPEMRGPRATNS
jgi:hypothetical protein